MSINIPSKWNDRITEAVQSAGYAMAMESMDYQPLLIEERGNAAAAYIRGRGGLLERFKMRATAYLNDYNIDSLKWVTDILKREHVPIARFGDTMFGADDPSGLEAFGADVVKRHSFITDLTLDEDGWLAGMNKNLRRDYRKSLRSDVRVHEVLTAEDVKNYFDLSNVTTQRVRKEKYYTQYPLEFFQAIAAMKSSDQAFMLLAKTGEDDNENVLAGGIFFISGKKALYYHGCSTRDRKHMPKQAPTLLLFNALVHAKARGCTQFDWGGVDPNASKEDSIYRIYRYKKRWGGEPVVFYTGEYTVSEPVVWLQEKILIPAYSKWSVMKQTRRN